MSRRFFWNIETKQLEEVSTRPAPEPRLQLMTGSFYEGTRATDGEDIGSRTKHREYMRRHGLTLADDYKETWAKQAEKREALAKGEDPGYRKRLREDIGRALYKKRNAR